MSVDIAAEFREWCAENDVELIGLQRQAADKMIVPLAEMMGRGSGKTYLLTMMEDFLHERNGNYAR